MKCNLCDCQTVLGPDEQFCGECGHVAAEHGVSAPPVTVQPVPPTPPQPVAIEPPVQHGTYNAEISRQNPACLIFLIDQSGSMEEPIAGGTGEKKKQVVADAVNRLLYNTILRCAKEDGVRPYFSVGIWSYGGKDVQRAFGTDLVSITEIAEHPKRTEVRRRRVPDGAGGVYEEEFQLPVWFDPVANGTTPMKAAFRTVVEPVRDWLNQHPASFPPIVLNLTDGAYSDDSPAPVVWELMQMGTADGNVLVFNCHISKQAGMATPFPNDGQAAGLEGLARELYDMSSPLPDLLRRQAQAKGYYVGDGARGYAFNADLVTMIDFLDIGTRVVQDRMEVA
jgi:hypothetical protein